MLELRAKEFATKAHAAVDQRRKYTNEPYIVHPAAVVELVRSVEHTEEMLAAAWLHDTVEDTEVTHEDIVNSFGFTVWNYVWYLTDVGKDCGNRKKRKEVDFYRLLAAPVAVKTIKLADLIHNTSSIMQYDPKFAKIYLLEKERLLTALTEGDPKLFEMAKAQIYQERE